MLQVPPSPDQFLSYWRRWADILNEELLRKEVAVLGWRDDGAGTLHVRFRAALATPWVQVHVQSTETGEGGIAAYDSSDYTSSTEVDCREDRVQDVTITDVSSSPYVVFLIPIQEDGSGTKVLYDGEGGRPDRMSYLEIGV